MKDSGATIDDVARLAGVSKRTVSRVINNSPSVGEATRQRIQEVMKALNYRPSAQARGLASGRSYLLGMMYDNPDALFIDQVQRGVLSVCREAGYELIVHPCDMDSPSLIEEAQRLVAGARLDGLLILPPVAEYQALAQALSRVGANYLRVGSVDFGDAHHVVVSQDRAAAADVADHLTDLGHRRIALVTGSPGLVSSMERVQGFQDRLEQRGFGLNPNWIVAGDYSFDSGVRAGLELLRSPQPPTAIFACNDEMAVGVMHAARELGLAVPESLSVVGFDDSMIAVRVRPALTTIKRPLREMAGLAASRLIERAGKSSADKGLEEAISVRPTLIARQSTAPPQG